MSSIIHLLRSKTSLPASILVASGGILVASSYVTQTTSLQQREHHQSEEHFQIETDLMQRIAQKPYLQAFTSNEQHPRGVPQRLRVLAIDVPEMRTSFDGECRLNLSKVYADGVAPPKEIDDDRAKHEKQKVTQKSLAKSLIKCRKQKKIGVELLEASVEDLNPNNMRRTHQFGNLLKYDPGKYATRPVGRRNRRDDGDEKTDPKSSSDDQDRSNRAPSAGGVVVRKDTMDGNVVEVTEDDELDAPWNQYAWIEEMQLRINGKVPFGSALSGTSKLSRVLYGNVYKTTVPSSRRFWEYFLPSILHRDPAGREGNRNNWASHKPHAVIADGAAMQRVPGSMRFLQKTCQEADVPLFIVNDPRVWGGNTHQDLADALKELRKTIKYRIVQESMRGSAFGRGRLLGQLETEAKWQVKDMGRRTREAVKKANRKLQKEKAADWSSLDADELQEKLARHRVVEAPKVKEEGVSVAKYCSDGMVALARRCVDSLVEEKSSKSSKDTSPAEARSEPRGALAEADVSAP